MQRILILMAIIVSIRSKLYISASILDETTETSSSLIESGSYEDEHDNESARKIIGSRVVTSVSVVMNGKEPQFADAVGNYIPRPLVPPRVASPVSLLDPDRYEFYTFNDDGELVKRLMTMEEIQGIVANGDSEQQVLAKNPTGIVDNEANIRDIVKNVQKVLHSEMSNNNFTTNLMYNKLDTPDTSGNWNSILPAIFGNTGESILTNKMPVTTGSTADSIIMHTTNKKPQAHKTPSTASILKTTIPPKTTAVNKITKQKPKPYRPSSSSSFATTIKPNSVTPQKNKLSSTSHNTQNTKNTLAPASKLPSQQSTIFTTKPTKISSPSKLTSIQSKPSTIYVQKLTQSTNKVTNNPTKITTIAVDTIATKKPVSKYPVTPSKYPTSALKTTSVSHTLPNTTHTTKIPTTTTTTTIQNTSTKKNKITGTSTLPPQSYNKYITTAPNKKKTAASTIASNTKTKITSNIINTENYTPKENLISSASTMKYIKTSSQPVTTRRTETSPIHPTTHSPVQTINPDAAAILEPEPDNIFDSELSLNQIIESLKDLEGTTMPIGTNYMDFVDVTTSEPELMEPFDKISSESVTIMNNGQNMNSLSYKERDESEFKHPVNSVSYIPQTTMDSSPFIETTEISAQNPASKIGYTNSNTQHYISMHPMFNIEHKESDDEMIIDEKTTVTNQPEITTTDSSLSKQSTNSMDTLLRESFDSVLSQVQNDGMSTTIDYNDIETTTILQLAEDSTTVKSNDTKKVVVKPTPYIPVEELEGVATEPMKYLEAIIKKHYEQEQNKNESFTTVQEEVTTEQLMSINATDRIETTTDSPSTEMSTENIAYETTSIGKIESETKSESSENQEYSPDSTTEAEEISTIQYIKDSTENQETISLKTDEDEDEFTFYPNEDSTTTLESVNENEETTTNFEALDQTTTANGVSQGFDENQTQYEMIQLIENIVKNITNNDKTSSNLQNITNSIERKEDSNELLNKTTAGTDSTVSTTQRDENEFSDLGETTTANVVTTEKIRNQTKPNTPKSPLSKLKIPTLAPILNNLKMKVVNALKNTNTINLDPAPKQALGLEESTAHAGEDILEFTRFCNEVAFNFWTVYNDGVSSARSLTLSPFALTSMLAMLFLGARGRTSGEIDAMLHLDDIVTFNPHAMLRNISESVDPKRDGNVYSNAFVRELLSERQKGKILPFFKEKVSQFYSGYVEEVNFSTVNDIIRRRTNLLMKRHSGGKVNEYLKTNNVWVKPPLAGISSNNFETDCSKASKLERDGEMFFQVLPAIRQRRLVPVPAVVWKSGFTAGYDPELDATAVAIGLSKNVVSTIFVMPGQQGHSAPGDNLERLESVLMVNAVSKNAWRRLLATLMERPGLEVQIPRFTHRSFVNTTNALRKLGLETLFDQNSADLRGITGSITRDMYVSDLIQINTFSTCGEDKLAEEHHTELYPAPPNKHRTIKYTTTTTLNSGQPIDYENERAFASDPIYDLKYLSLPLPLRPRQARIPEAPRLRFDKPFIYFVRHNPTGMVLYFGRFNPRLLP